MGNQVTSPFSHKCFSILKFSSRLITRVEQAKVNHITATNSLFSITMPEVYSLNWTSLKLYIALVPQTLHVLSNLGFVVILETMRSPCQTIHLLDLTVGPGRLCLKHHLSFYSFIPPKWAYNSLKVAYYSCIIPRFCISQVQNRPQNIETE